MPRRFAFALAMLMTLSIPTLYAATDDDSLDDIQGKLGNEWMLVKNDQRRNIKTYAKLHTVNAGFFYCASWQHTISGALLRDYHY